MRIGRARHRREVPERAGDASTWPKHRVARGAAPHSRAPCAMAKGARLERRMRELDAVARWALVVVRGEVTEKSPAVARSSPEIRRSSVDLPHPEGPRIATNAPCSISSSMPSSATVPSAKTCLIPRADTQGGSVPARASDNLVTGCKLNGSPELLLDLMFQAVPELFCRLGGCPNSRRWIDVEMPSARARRHPNLTCRAMAIDDEAMAIVELDGDDAAFEIRPRARRSRSAPSRARGARDRPGYRNLTFVERIGH